MALCFRGRWVKVFLFVGVTSFMPPLGDLKLNKRALDDPVGPCHGIVAGNMLLKGLPDASTNDILLHIEANEHNVEGCKAVHCVRHNVKVIEKSMTGNNWSTLDVLIILHGYLWKVEGLEYTRDVVQELPRVRSRSSVFGRIGQACCFGVLKSTPMKNVLKTVDLEVKTGYKQQGEEINPMVGDYSIHG
ncbi:hypothetical protein Ancab_007287 [Ancistrocladus abbreviatus]